MCVSVCVCVCVCVCVYMCVCVCVYDKYIYNLFVNIHTFVYLEKCVQSNKYL